MPQKCKNTFGKRSASESYDFDESNYFKREIFLDYEQWQNIADSKRPWYEYNHNNQDRKEIAAIHRMIIPCINEIILSDLSNRQKEIVTMYFLSNYTQVEISLELGISQPTVNQHLNGKRRNGKKIGGSIRKIRKTIHRMSSSAKQNQSHYQVIHILDKLLDAKTTLRKSHDLIRSMLK